MRYSHTVFVLWFLGFVSGCSTPTTLSSVEVKTTHNPDTDFPRRGTFAFMRAPAVEMVVGDEFTAVDDRVRTAIQKELWWKGFSKAERNQADFLVDYSVSLRQARTTVAARAERAGEHWLEMVSYVEDYARGALWMEFADTKTGLPVWRGVANGNVALQEVSESEKDKRVAYAARELLKDFPPKK